MVLILLYIFVYISLYKFDFNYLCQCVNAKFLIFFFMRFVSLVG